MNLAGTALPARGASHTVGPTLSTHLSVLAHGLPQAKLPGLCSGIYMHALQFYVVSVLPRLLPTVADSERCALAQAGPFNSHTLAEQALNQPGREVGGSETLLSPRCRSGALWWSWQPSGTSQRSLKHTTCLHGFWLLLVTESAPSTQQLDDSPGALTCCAILN